MLSSSASRIRMARWSVIATALIAAVILAAWSFMRDELPVVATIPQSIPITPITESITPVTGTINKEPQPSAKSADPVSDSSALAAQTFKSFARHTSLRVINPDTLGLAAPVVELLQLTPTQAQGVDQSVRRFIERLQSQELAHAYISVDADGNEEIVVSAFDKTPLINGLQNEVSKNVNPDVAALIAERIPFDYSLGVTNSQMRLSITTGDDEVERVSFTRSVLRPDAVDDKTPIAVQGFAPGLTINFSPTNIITTTRPIRNGLDPRYAHLFRAENVLPRRAETGPKK